LCIEIHFLICLLSSDNAFKGWFFDSQLSRVCTTRTWSESVSPTVNWVVSVFSVRYSLHILVRHRFITMKDTVFLIQEVVSALVEVVSSVFTSLMYNLFTIWPIVLSDTLITWQSVYPLFAILVWARDRAFLNQFHAFYASIYAQRLPDHINTIH
jgi:hypothetical protein